MIRIHNQRIFIVWSLVAMLMFVTACSNNQGGATNSDPSSSGQGANTTENTPKNEDKSQSEVPSEVRIGYQVIPNAELLTKTLGLAEAKFPNSKITWVQFDSGRDVNTAIASGGIDLGLAGSVPVAIGLASDVPYQVYFLHDIIGDNEALAVRQEAGIKSIADLEGKKVAVPFGSTTHFSLLSALKEASVDPGKVTILDLQPPDILAAWTRGDIDGAFVWQPTLAKLVESDGQILTTAKQLSEKGIITADVGVVSTAFAEKYPDFLKQYVGVLDEAVGIYRSKPEEAAKSIADYIGQSEADSLAQMNELVWLSSSEQREQQYLGKGQGSGFAQVLKQTGEFLVAQHTIQSAPELAVFEAAIRAESLEQ